MPEDETPGIPLYYGIMYWDALEDREICAYTMDPEVALEKVAQLIARDVDQFSLTTHVYFAPLNSVDLDALPASRKAKTRRPLVRRQLKVGKFTWDGKRIGGPGDYMQPRGLTFIDSRRADTETGKVPMREMLGLLQSDLEAWRRGD